MASVRNQQEELRRLMRERMAGRSSAGTPSTSATHQLKSNESDDSCQNNNPFAKVTSSGKTICTICPGVTIKSWKTHQLSGEHKRNLKTHRAGQTTAGSAVPPKLEPKQRPAETKPLLPKEPARSILKNPLVKAQPLQRQEQSRPDTKEPSESIGEPAANGAGVSGVATGSAHPTLKRHAPATSNDEASEAKLGKLEEAVTQEKAAAGGAGSALPEGFFDDPRLDAKARNQEYRDPLEVEWDRYQKALREEENKSEQVVEMDDERDTRERNIYEADEQIRNWETVRELEIRREEQHAKPTEPNHLQKSKVNPDSNNATEADEDVFDNEELDELMSWRQKSIKK